MNILLVCTTGVSTGMLVKNMQTAAERRKITVQINAVPEVQLRENAERADVVLLGPQVRYLQEKIKTIVAGKPVQVIDAKDYGMMDGESVLNMALDLLQGDKICGM
jgi:PTS system cellobiose-specific IIB component